MTTVESLRTAEKRAWKTDRLRRADAALIRVVGMAEAILLAQDEDTAVRRASVALTHRDAEGRTNDWHPPDRVAAALAGWWKLRGDVAA